MFRNGSLQSKLIGAFLLMGGIVLVVALIGWLGNSRMNQHVTTLSDNTLPSIIGLWQINEGQTQIESVERWLLNPMLNAEDRKEAFQKLEQATLQINEGFKIYENAEKIPEEEKLYQQKFLPQWDRWQDAHKNFLKIEEEFHILNMRNPWQVEIDLLSKDQEKSLQMIAAQKASNLYEKMENYREGNKSLFDEATNSMLELIRINEGLNDVTFAAAERDAKNSTMACLIGLILGPVTAILLGIVLSKEITRPLVSVINMISTSSTEIAATVAQQERIASEQASSVNQTTSTMDELGASSNQSAKQAESAVQNAQLVLEMAHQGSEGARQVLHLAREGHKVVTETLEGISVLQEKVEEISRQISHLSQQVTQITSITNMVQDIANQTNILALNASVEAARAGQQGRGFAVVATEIRKLADQSKGSAEKINLLVLDIQNVIMTTVRATEEGKKNADQGIKLSRRTAGAFNGVVEAIETIVLKNQESTIAAINDAVVTNQQIALTAGQQAIAVTQVVAAMNNINTGAQQTAAGISQTKIGISKLNEAAQHLQLLGGS